MGSPYNFLQNLQFDYSGREIGIATYKPYTFSNETPQFQVSYYGSMFQSILERTYSYNARVQSGSLDGGIKESSRLRFHPSGSQIAHPSDIVSVRVSPTGIQRFIPIASARLIFSPTGLVGNNLVDNFNYSTRVPTGLLESCVSDKTLSVSHYIKSGGLQRSDRDVAAITFSFFTGSYYSGAFTPPHVPVNRPATGIDAASITFTMFTGTYQGA